MSDTKRRIADWIYKHISFPNGCKHGNELSWMLKDNCPCCTSNPIETLSNKEYHERYPARNILTLGSMKIYLCDYHMDELKNKLLKTEKNNEFNLIQELYSCCGNQERFPYERITIDVNKMSELLEDVFIKEDILDFDKWIY